MRVDYCLFNTQHYEGAAVAAAIGGGGGGYNFPSHSPPPPLPRERELSGGDLCRPPVDTKRAGGETVRRVRGKAKGKVDSW